VSNRLLKNTLNIKINSDLKPDP